MKNPIKTSFDYLKRLYSLAIVKNRYLNVWLFAGLVIGSIFLNILLLYTLFFVVKDIAVYTVTLYLLLITLHMFLYPDRRSRNILYDGIERSDVVYYLSNDVGRDSVRVDYLYKVFPDIRHFILNHSMSVNLLYLLLLTFIFSMNLILNNTFDYSSVFGILVAIQSYITIVVILYRTSYNSYVKDCEELRVEINTFCWREYNDDI